MGFDCIPHWLDDWCILPLIHIDTSEVFIRFPLWMVTQWIVCSWKAIHGYPGYQLFVKSAPKCLKGLPWAVTPPSELSQVEKCKGTCITWRFLVALLRQLFWRLRLIGIEQCFVHSALLFPGWSDHLALLLLRCGMMGRSLHGEIQNVVEIAALCSGKCLVEGGWWLMMLMVRWSRCILKIP